MRRLTRDEVNVKIAELIAERGTCQRAKVGAVITLEHRIISSGYNGSLNDKHCTGCDVTSKCNDAVHAEANAIAFAAKEGVKLEGATIYCTMSPCYECSKLIIQAGLREVVYKEEYRDSTPLEFLKQHGIIVRKAEPAIITDEPI